MEIKFHWKHSDFDMPKHNEHIIVFLDGVLWKGRFQDEKYMTEYYHRKKKIFGLLGCEFSCKRTLTFGPQVIVELPLSGFNWDKPSLNYNKIVKHSDLE